MIEDITKIPISCLKRGCGVQAMPETMTFPEVQSMLRKTRPTIVAWIKRKAFPQPYKLGGHWRFRRNDVVGFAEGRLPPSAEHWEEPTVWSGREQRPAGGGWERAGSL